MPGVWHTRRAVMKNVNWRGILWLALAAVVIGLISRTAVPLTAASKAKAAKVPLFQLDPAWPRIPSKFVMQSGHSGQSKGNQDTANLNRPADVFVYPKTNEFFVADGYGNRRVIVYDADTGAYKRMWGAFGKEPKEVEPTPAGQQPARE